MTLVTVTENHILESALFKAMVLHTFLGTAKVKRFWYKRHLILYNWRQAKKSYRYPGWIYIDNSIKVSSRVYEVNMAIASWSPFLSIRKIKTPAWYYLKDEAVVLFHWYFTFEWKPGWHRSFLKLESTRGIQTPVVVLELLEEMVAYGYRNVKFYEKFQILLLKLREKFI